MLSPLKVLVIDGDLMILELVVAMLVKAGHFPITALSAQEGLKKFDEGGFDLVLAHYGMAGLKGDELAALLKKRPNPKPVILVTTGPAPPPSEHVDRVLIKPFTENQLSAVIQETTTAKSA